MIAKVTDSQQCVVETFTPHNTRDTELATLEIEKIDGGCTLMVKVQLKEEIREPKFVTVRVYIPEHFDVNLNLSGNAQCTIQDPIKELVGCFRGTALCKIESCTFISVHLSNESIVECRNVCSGPVRIECMHNSGATLYHGRFISVRAECSGKASIRTRGICEGSYYANATDQSTIIHYGQLHGAWQREKSDEATVSFFVTNPETGSTRKKRSSSISSISSCESDGSPRKKKAHNNEPPRSAQPPPSSAPPLQKKGPQKVWSAEELRAFNTIGILPTEDFDIIRVVYLKKCHKLHPDRAGAAMHGAFTDLQSAYDLLEGLYGSK